jgi:aryl-alcohol dehydrogenase-like predicted oxidoreductase
VVHREEEREMIPLCRDLGVGGNPYSPRARGFLTHHSRYADGERTPRASNDPLAESMYGDDDLAVVAAVGAIARCGFAAEHRSYARAVVSVNVADMPITE